MHVTRETGVQIIFTSEFKFAFDTDLHSFSYINKFSILLNRLKQEIIPSKI
jgi:hypothetical protein